MWAPPSHRRVSDRHLGALNPLKACTDDETQEICATCTALMVAPPDGDGMGCVMGAKDFH